MEFENIHFVTGRLAETALRKLLPDVASRVGFEYSVQALPITVAALMTPKWIAPRLEIPDSAKHVMLPGYCDGDLSAIREITDLPILIGPKDLRLLPEYFGQPQLKPGFGQWDIEIIAEINHAPRFNLAEILRQAESLRSAGANLIDVGCEPNSTWTGVGECVRALKEQGHRVSIDSLNPVEIQAAADAGAELVLSVNQSNLEAAPDWGCEVVVIPNDIRDLRTLEASVDFLADQRVPLRIDPILEPIGFGFAASLDRYQQARRLWPEAEMMMGIGNLTELTDVDSAGINVLLLAICQELGVRSVLTTQVINWARTSVRECDLARRLVHYAVKEQVPPKHLSTQLVSLRDAKIVQFAPEEIDSLTASIKDHNYRILAEQGEVHLLGGGQRFSDGDPFNVFDALMDSGPTNVDPSHAFYLGYEMCKAMIALQLGKQYTQDQSLDWGYLTVDEQDRHRLKRRIDRS